MAYYTKVLQPDEQVRVIGSLHWSIYIRPVIILLIAACVLIGSLKLLDPTWQLYAQYAGAAIAILGLLVLLAAWIKRRTTEIVVTDRRVIHKVGVLVRHTQEMNVSKVEIGRCGSGPRRPHLGLRQRPNPRDRLDLGAFERGGVAGANPQRDRGGLNRPLCAPSVDGHPPIGLKPPPGWRA